MNVKGNQLKVSKIKQLYFKTLVICYYGDSIENTDFFQNTSFKESNAMAVEKNLTAAIIFLGKNNVY